MEEVDVVCAAFVKVKFAVLVRTTEPLCCCFFVIRIKRDRLLPLFAVRKLTKVTLILGKRAFSLRNIHTLVS